MKQRFSFKDLRTGAEFRVELDIDVAELAREMAVRARRTKSGKAKVLGGVIKCTVVAERGEE